MTDYLIRYEIKEEINKDDYKQQFRRNYFKDSLPFNLLMIFLVLMVGILLIRSKEIVWYKFIIWYLIYLCVMAGIDQVSYILDFKALQKYNEHNKQIYTIYKDHIEIVRNGSKNVRIFKFSEAHEISYREDRNRFRFLFSDGKVNVNKDKITDDVYEYLMSLCR